MQALLTSGDFRDPQTYGVMIKSPVDLIVGTLRVFQFPMGNGRGIVRASRRLGQDLMDPPNVKGWTGGNSWISSDTLLVRQQLMDRFLRGREMRQARKSTRGSAAMAETMPMAAMTEFGKNLDNESITKLLLPIPPVAPVKSITDPQELISVLVQDPVYQLK